MKTNGLIIGITSIIIGIVVVMAVMIPIIDSSTKEQTVITNTDTYCYYDKVDSFTLTNGYLNDTLLADIVGSQPLGYGLVVTDKFVAINYKSNDAFTLWSVLTDTGLNRQVNVTVENYAYTLTAVSDNSVVDSGVLEFAYIPSVTGDFGIIGDNAFTLNKSDNIVFVTNGSSDFGVSVGTVNNMNTIFKYQGGSEVTDFVPTINYVLSDDSNGIEISRTTGASIIAPIDSIVTVQSEGTVYDIIGILPVFVVVGLVFSVFYLFYFRR